MHTRVFLVEGEDRYFLHNRADLARELMRLGCEVEVLANETDKGEQIRSLGCRFHALNSRRGQLSPLRDLGLIARIARLQRERRPQLVHHFTLKPVLFGSLAARLRPGMQVFNSVTGLGYLFTDPGRNRLARELAKIAYRFSLGRANSQTIVQNRDDQKYFLEQRLCPPARLHLIRGSGVDCRRFHPQPEPAGPVQALFVGRFLGDKGIFEFIEAARIHREAGSEVQFVLVGDLDPGHPTSVRPEQLRAWVHQGLVRLRGYSENIVQEIRECHVVVLPSHREGLPKVLIEGAACGRPLIAADAPGSREVVIPEKTGLLVPLRDPAGLAAAIARLASNPELRARLGMAARELALQEFSTECVLQQILGLYRSRGLEL
jgi:glycosyltransferase involved in cell wall biosynthesis